MAGFRGAYPPEFRRQMVELVARTSARLLVMGAYGHSPLRNFIVGSTTTALMRACPVPVLLFR